MNTPPFMPLYVDDFEAATAHLTLEEDGAYNRLMRLCWRSPKCSVPDDPAWIARQLRIDRKTYDRVVAPLIDEFFKRSRGRIFQKRLRAEFGSASEAIQKKKTAGKLGGEAKARKTNKNRSSNATPLLEQKSSTPLLTRTITNKPPIVPQAGDDTRSDFDRYVDHVAAEFDEWWKAYPHKVGIDAARKAFARRRRDGADLQPMIAGAKRYAANKPPNREWVNPSKWLNEGRWEDEPDDGKPATVRAEMNGYHPKAKGRTDADRLRWQALLDKGAKIDAAATKAWLEPLIMDGDELLAPSGFHRLHVEQQMWQLTNQLGMDQFKVVYRQPEGADV